LHASPTAAIRLCQAGRGGQVRLSPLVLHPRHLFTYSPVMFGMGLGELAVILVIVMIIFGAGRLPEIGEGLGRGIRNFRKAVKTPDEIDITPKPDEQKGPGEGKTQSS